MSLDFISVSTSPLVIPHRTMKYLSGAVLLACLTTTQAFTPHTYPSRPATSVMAWSTAALKSDPKTGNSLPSLPIPEPLLSLTPGTWAYDTMSRRLNKEILQRTYEENEETFNKPEFAKALARFNELRAELDNAAETKLTYLKFDEVEDGRKGVLAPGDSEYKSETVVDREKREWEDILRPFVEKGDTWLSAPWLVTEVCFHVDCIFIHVSSFCLQ